MLGKEGLINSVLLRVGLIHEPLSFLLYSSFAVVVAYVHQLTIFMIVPIFNSMARIDKRLVEAADRDDTTVGRKADTRSVSRAGRDSVCARGQRSP